MSGSEAKKEFTVADEEEMRKFRHSLHIPCRHSPTKPSITKMHTQGSIKKRTATLSLICIAINTIRSPHSDGWMDDWLTGRMDG